MTLGIADMPVPEFLRVKQRTVYEIAEQYWDLKGYPTQYVFSLLAQVSEDKLERDKCLELSSAEGQEDWLNYARRPKRTVLEVILVLLCVDCSSITLQKNFLHYNLILFLPILFCFDLF